MSILKKLAPSAIHHTAIAGEPITAIMTSAPGNKAPIGGLKITTANGWFAVRPSGTEPIYKIYAESLTSAEHLDKILEEARAVVTSAVAGA
jgi:phosphoglucomutase